jgi:uncharacterized membrane protein YhaH (DUF805 family)
METFLNVLKNKYADFDGRARRNEYWMFVLFNVIITIIGYAISLFGIFLESAALGILGTAFLFITGLGLLIPSLAVRVRRLHDTNRSGWLLLIGLIPFIGFIILLVFLVSEGTQGPNNYGPDPKNPINELDGLGKNELV